MFRVGALIPDTVTMPSPTGRTPPPLSFGGFAPGLSYPRRPSNRTLAGDKTGRGGVPPSSNASPPEAQGPTAIRRSTRPSEAPSPTEDRPARGGGKGSLGRPGQAMRLVGAGFPGCSGGKSDAHRPGFRSPPPRPEALAGAWPGLPPLEIPGGGKPSPWPKKHRKY